MEGWQQKTRTCLLGCLFNTNCRGLNASPAPFTAIPQQRSPTGAFHVCVSQGALQKRDRRTSAMGIFMDIRKGNLKLLFAFLLLWCKADSDDWPFFAPQGFHQISPLRSWLGSRDRCRRPSYAKGKAHRIGSSGKAGNAQAFYMFLFFSFERSTYFELAHFCLLPSLARYRGVRVTGLRVQLQNACFSDACASAA